MQNDSQNPDSDAGGDAGRDTVVCALEQIAAVAAGEAQVQAQIAAAARGAMCANGSASSADRFGKRVREVLDLVAGSTERLVGSAAELRRAWAAQMAAQGLSRRDVAARMGITRQRASVLLGAQLDSSGERQ